jgi:hypothetical protein
VGVRVSRIQNAAFFMAVLSPIASVVSRAEAGNATDDPAPLPVRFGAEMDSFLTWKNELPHGGANSRKFRGVHDHGSQYVSGTLWFIDERVHR